MIKNGEFYMIHEMRKRGMSITQIAEEQTGNESGQGRQKRNQRLPSEEAFSRKVRLPHALDF